VTLFKIIVEDRRTNKNCGALTPIILATYRVGHYFYTLSSNGSKPKMKRTVACIFYKMVYMIHRFLTLMMSCYLPIPAQFGRRIRFPHSLHGIFVSNKAKIGNDVTIFHHVTIGSDYLSRTEARRGAPKVMDGAILGAGAKVIGNVRIGKQARIGAGAIVTRDIPDNATAVLRGLEIITRN